ncbi:hypothetical protein K525DRAFT_192999, partial [Schizophyllum commune Loenen D]
VKDLRLETDGGESPVEQLKLFLIPPRVMPQTLTPRPRFPTSTADLPPGFPPPCRSTLVDFSGSVRADEKPRIVRVRWYLVLPRTAFGDRHTWAHPPPTADPPPRLPKSATEETL